MIEYHVEPRIDAVAGLAVCRKVGRLVIRVRRLLEIRRMAGNTRCG